MEEPKMDEALIMAFRRDDPFTMDDGSFCFFNPSTGEIFWAGEGAGLDPEEPYQNSPEWIEVPGTPHSVWHDEFRRFLAEQDCPEVYCGSIGGTLRAQDDGLRYSWEERIGEVAAERARNWLLGFAEPDEGKVVQFEQ